MYGCIIKSSILVFVVGSSAKKEDQKVDYLLRTQGWPTKSEEILRLENKTEIVKSSFDASKPTTFLIHGYTEDTKTPNHQRLSRALVEAEDQNFFFVDWGSRWKSTWYLEAVDRVPKVAKDVAEFITFLNESAALKLEKTTIVGFSMGAHIAGLASRVLKNGKVDKIIGLDPAGPFFLEGIPKGRLNAPDARYVECIHTGFFLGILEPICQVDFYLNGGKDQPGCEAALGTYNTLCSHYKVIDVFIKALATPKTFYGQRCDSLIDALGKKCNGTTGAFFNDKRNAENALTGIFHISLESKPNF